MGAAPGAPLPTAGLSGSVTGEGGRVLRSQLAQAPASHAWLFDLLFARTPTVTWAVAGALPAGFDRAEQFAVLPAGGGRSFMVSLAARRGASSALTSYNALPSGRTRPRPPGPRPR